MEDVRPCPTCARAVSRWADGWWRCPQCGLLGFGPAPVAPPPQPAPAWPGGATRGPPTASYAYGAPPGLRTPTRGAAASQPPASPSQVGPAYATGQAAASGIPAAFSASGNSHPPVPEGPAAGWVVPVGPQTGLPSAPGGAASYGGPPYGAAPFGAIPYGASPHPANGDAMPAAAYGGGVHGWNAWEPPPGMPEVEPDAFWSERAPQRMPRWEQGEFWARPPPAERTPFMHWAAATQGRLAAILAGAGTLAVFVYQQVPLASNPAAMALPIMGSLLMLQWFVFQVVVSAPLFEEWVKFGLALLALSPLTLRGLRASPFLEQGVRLVAALGFAAVGYLLARPFGLGPVGVAAAGVASGAGYWALQAASMAPVRAIVVLARMAVALQVGAAFGIFEHFAGYSDEDTLGFVWRIAFHSLSTGLSMACYCAFEPLPDTRVRWLSTGLASLLHYANNGFGSAIVLVTVVVGGNVDAVAASVSGLVVVLVALSTVAVLAAGRPVRLLVARAVQRRWPQ